MIEFEEKKRSKLFLLICILLFGIYFIITPASKKMQENGGTSYDIQSVKYLAQENSKLQSDLSKLKSALYESQSENSFLHTTLNTQHHTL